MSIETKAIVSRIGETDQLYLTENTPELALERAELRMQLVTLSRVRQEQIHFLQEAIVLLEQARMEYEEMPMSLYLNLSLHLAKAYMLYFELNKEKTLCADCSANFETSSSSSTWRYIFLLGLCVSSTARVCTNSSLAHKIFINRSM